MERCAFSIEDGHAVLHKRIRLSTEASLDLAQTGSPEDWPPGKLSGRTFFSEPGDLEFDPCTTQHLFMAAFLGAIVPYLLPTGYMLE